MKKPNFSKLAKNFKVSVSKHSPEILVGIGIAGMLSTTVLAVKATPKALDLISQREDELEFEKLPKIEIIKTCWKCYAPAFVTAIFSTSCIIGASSVHARRNAALATAYKISETALTEYREKVIETIGEKKEHEIREKVDKDRIEKNPVGKNEVIITDKGDTLCYDTISGRYFKSDIDKIRRAENALNKRMFDDVYVSLNEFYDELELDHTSVGYDLGWSIYDGMLDLHFSTQMADDEKTPCIVIDYEVAPKYNYDRLS